MESNTFLFDPAKPKISHSRVGQTQVASAYEAGMSLLENYTSGLCANLLKRSIKMFSSILDDIDKPD